MWRQHADRATYDRKALADRARFVRETAEYDAAMDEYEEAVEAAKKAAEAAEFAAAEAEDAAREQRREAEAERKALAAKRPKAVRTLSAVEQRMRDHNAAMKAAAEDPQRAAARTAFILSHAEVLRPFVSPGILDKEAAKPRKAGAAVPKLTTTPEWIKQGQLRDYQLEGVSWMLQTHAHGVSGILGDEMGLGKTVQTITFLSYLKYQMGLSGPFLVVAPMSVLSSWMTEFRRWCPSFRTIKLHSSDANERDRMRRTVLPDVNSYDCIVTTYEMVKSASFNNSLRRIRFRYLVIDEGHVIKNEATQISQTLRKLNYNSSLLLTGTPLQNNMHELWALLNFLYPYIFPDGSSDAFDSAFNLAASKVDDDMLTKAHYMLRPFVLRRIKADVEKTLPPKEEIKLYCPLSEMQAFWYKNLLMRESSLLQQGASATARGEELEQSGKTQYQQLNNLLMQLRKCCMHPFLFEGAEDDPESTPVESLIEASGKLQILDRLLAKLKEHGHRVVLFSQFTRCLDILEDFVRARGYQYSRLDGGTNRVQRTVDISTFNSPDSPYFLFLMSTRAGGLGVNLQTADTAILYDSDWNPQADLQAMARVHRIGQKKPVHVYRMVTRGTVEERIIQRAEKKLYLDQMVNRGSSVQADKLDKLDTGALMKMLTFGADKIMAADSADEQLSDADLSRLIDRSSVGAKKAEGSAEGSDASSKLQTGTTQTAADFKPELPLMMTQTLQGQTFEKKSLGDLGREWRELKGKRQQKSRLMQVGSHQVLKVNDYELGKGLSVFDAEQKGKWGAGTKKSSLQLPGRDYDNEAHCLLCWDGGDLVLCDGCPASYHPACLARYLHLDESGPKPWEISFGRWMCPHHECDECGRKAAAAGGMLFRCTHCPKAFCEDHLPLQSNVLKTCDRFKKLGQNHPQQACFILCSETCKKFSQSEEGGGGAQSSGINVAASIGAAANVGASKQGAAWAPSKPAAAAAAAAPKGATSSSQCIPADSFQGAKPGYSFKLGADGLGYYADACQSTATAMDTDGSRSPSRSDDAGRESMLATWQFLCKHNANGRAVAGIFMDLPAREMYPDYYQLISVPMSLQLIRQKIETGGYSRDSSLFESDVLLMFANARRYNLPGSQVCQDAAALEAAYRRYVSDGGEHATSVAPPAPDQPVPTASSNGEAAPLPSATGSTGGMRPVNVKPVEGGKWVQYQSLTQAAEATGADRSDVSKCCRGKIPHLRGYLFRYVPENELPPEPAKAKAAQAKAAHAKAAQAKAAQAKAAQAKAAKAKRQSGSALVEVRAYMQSHQLAQSIVAQESRVSQSVLSQWLSQKYKHNNDKVDAAMWQWLSERKAAAAAAAARVNSSLVVPPGVPDDIQTWNAFQQCFPGHRNQSEVAAWWKQYQAQGRAKPSPKPSSPKAKPAKAKPAAAKPAAAESFEVEKIVGKRCKGGRNEYRVRWKGFAEDDDTWEPVANLDDAGVAIREYEQSQASVLAASTAPSPAAAPQLRPGDVVDIDRKFAVGDGGRGTIVSEDAEGNYVVKYAGGGPQEKGVPPAALTRPDASASEESGGRRSRRSSIAEPRARPTASPAISPPASATSMSPPATGTESKPLKISSARARIGQSVEVCRRDSPASFEV